MRKMLLVLAAAFLLLPVFSSAGPAASALCIYNGANLGQLFGTTAACTSTATLATTVSTAGSALVLPIYLDKLELDGVLTATAMTIQLWDAPKGLTTSTGAKLRDQINYVASSTVVNHVTRTYVTNKGGTDRWYGMYFKYMPVLVQTDAGVNSPVARIEYENAPSNKTQGSYGQ